MTTTKSAPVDYLHETPSHGIGHRPASTREGDDHGAHLLRLVLDLQLDALLLGLGAAAVQEARSPVPASAPEMSGGAPWPRWAMEDVDLARTLAAEAVTSGAALPATLGPEPAAQEERIVLDRLAARYESMQALLTDLLDRAGNDPALGASQLQVLMAHCARRLAELHGLATHTRPGVAANAPARAYLPGELLG